uniref:Uncharacterized protein n=1 Tax=Rhizophora mucronata TaxID=61149 RepID=A0A2P2P9H7_RHIMU
MLNPKEASNAGKISLKFFFFSLPPFSRQPNGGSMSHK